MEKRPNLLIILADQLRRQALGCYGDPNVSTPHIDALAQGGVRCDAVSATCPVCVPFRFSLMTGQYAHSRMVPAISWRMSPAEKTLADDFAAGGYRTLYFGKWHLYGGSGPGLMKKPVPRQFQGHWEEWYGFEFRNNFFDNVCFYNDDPTPVPLPGYQTDAVFSLAIDRLSRQGDNGQPFCAVISVEAPHPPFGAPESYECLWRDRKLILPPNFMVSPTARDMSTEPSPAYLEPGCEAEVAKWCRSYYAMIENLDDNLGRLMRALCERGIADDTIVVLLSDHGELMGSHCQMGKQFPYEESCGIPFVAAGPGVPSGGVVDEPMATEDLYPTLLGLAGLTSGQDLPGMDLSLLIRGEGGSVRRRGVLLEFVHEYRPGMPFYNQSWRGFRSRRYKYGVLGARGEAMRPWCLFDLQEDPFELVNRIGDPDLAGVSAEHHHWLRERMVETEDHEWLATAFGCQEINARAV